VAGQCGLHLYASGLRFLLGQRVRNRAPRRQINRDLVALAPIAGNLQDRWARQAAMREQKSFLENGFVMPDRGRHRQACQRARLVKHLAREGQRHQSRSRLDQRQPELPRQRIAQPRRAHFWNGFATRSHHQPRRTERACAADHLKTLPLRDRANLCAQNQRDACGVHIRPQHGNDLARRAVAEQLSQSLFMPRDPCIRHALDKIPLRVTL